MSEVVLSCWFKYRNCLPCCQEAIWLEYESDRESLERKISLRHNPLNFAMGFLFIPDSSVVDASPMHTGYIQFAEDVSLTEVTNLIGIKKMQFMVTNDMSHSVTEFKSYCIHEHPIFFCAGVPYELKPVVCDDGSIPSEDDADDASDLSDVIQACSSFPSSISSGSGRDSSYRCSELCIENEDECIDGTEYLYESSDDMMDSASVVSSISTVSPLHGFVVAEVVDLTNDDSVHDGSPNEGLNEAVLANELHPADLTMDRSHHVELPNEFIEAQLSGNESLRGGVPIIVEGELPNGIHEVELLNNGASQVDQLIVDDVSDDLSFSGMLSILDRNITQLSLYRPDHAFRFFTVSIELIERTPYSGTNVSGVYHKRFQDTASLLDPSYQVIDRCSSCMEPLRGQVIAHRCTCDKWNINHWICFKANFASHLHTYLHSVRVRDYLFPCDSCRDPLFDNHSYLKSC